MSNINITVAGRELQVADGYEKPSAGDVNTCSVSISLDSAWEQFPGKRVTFSSRTASVTVDYAEEMQIPWEAIQKKGALYVGVTGYDLEGNELMRTHKQTYPIEVATPSDDEGATPSPATLDVVSRVDALAQRLEGSEDAREATFQASETNREDTFQATQAARSASFASAQQGRASEFGSKMVEWGQAVDSKVAQASSAIDTANAAASNADSKAAIATAAAENASEKASIAASKAVEAESAATAANAAKQAADAASATANAAAATATAAAGNAQGIADTVQAKLDAGEFKGEKGDKGDPGEVTLEQLNAVDKQVQKNDARLDIVESVLSEGYFGWQLESETSYDHAVPANAVTVKDENYSFAQMVGLEGQSVVWDQGAAVTYVTQTVHLDNPLPSGHVYYVGMKSDYDVTSTNKLFFDAWGGTGWQATGLRTGFDEKKSIYEFVKQSTNTIVNYGVQNASSVNIPATDVRIVDLTRLFGSGNEPTSLDDPRIEWVKRYAAEHPEYNEGQVVSANVTEIQSWGKNLLNPVQLNQPFGGGVVYKGVSFLNLGFKKLTYTISVKDGASVPTTAYVGLGGYLKGASSISLPYGWGIAKGVISTASPYATKKTWDMETLANTYENFGVIMYSDNGIYPPIIDCLDVQVERGDTATPFSPYGMKDSIELPELDLKSAGTARDRADFLADEVTRKTFETTIDGTNSAYSPSANCAIFIDSRIKNASSIYELSNVVCDKLPTISAAAITTGGVGICANNAYNRLLFRWEGFAAASDNDVKAYMNAHPMNVVFELAEPTTEPFTVPKSFMQAEPNGYVRFAQPDDTMPVPNAISFPVDRKAALNG